MTDGAAEPMNPRRRRCLPQPFGQVLAALLLFVARAVRAAFLDVLVASSWTGLSRRSSCFPWSFCEVLDTLASSLVTQLPMDGIHSGRRGIAPLPSKAGRNRRWSARGRFPAGRAVPSRADRARAKYRGNAEPGHRPGAADRRWLSTSTIAMILAAHVVSTGLPRLIGPVTSSSAAMSRTKPSIRSST
jgi:hypothetical protein